MSAEGGSPAPPARRPRRGEELELTLDELDERGLAVGRAGPWRVRVQGAVPGMRVRARLGGRRKKVQEARLLEVLDPGPDGVAPRCPHEASCGGCTFQRQAYPAQLRSLHAALVRTLDGAFEPAGLPRAEVEPVVPAPEPWHYRNKMDFTFGSRRWIEPGEPDGVDSAFALGLHVPGRFDKVLDVSRCDIAFEGAAALVATTRRLAREAGLTPWDVRAHTGLLRHLVVREGRATGEILVNLVTTEEAPDEVAPLVRGLLAAHPRITTLVQTVNPGVALVATGEERVLHGPGRIRDVVGGLEFSISAQSFFQTNTLQAERLVALALAEAAVSPGEVVFDLYSGGGLFALHLARAGARVIGFEVVDAAVDDAERNARANGLDGLRFVRGDLASTLALALADEACPRPEVVLVDPPRAGLHESVLAELVRLGARRIVYVSCNPRTAARDVVRLAEGGYRPVRIQPVDLFPHTPHLECVVTLDLSCSPVEASSAGC